MLDASVTLAWRFHDEPSEPANFVFERLSSDIAIVPAIWALEVANGLLAAERRGRYTPAGIAETLAILESLPIELRPVPADEALGPILALAREQGLTGYDAAYLRLAMREGAALASFDRDLRAAATRVGVPLLV